MPRPDPRQLAQQVYETGDDRPRRLERLAEAAWRQADWRPSMTGPQFTADEADRAHRRLSDRILAEQVKGQPEPDHEPRCDRIHVWGESEPVRALWCCDSHRLHNDMPTPPELHIGFRERGDE